MSMSRKFWIDLTSSLVVAMAIILATALASLAGESRWLVMSGPLLLALALVCSDVLDSGLRGPLSRPSWAALILGAAVFLACLLVSFRDPCLVKSFLPWVGIAGWITLFSRPESRRKACWGL
jgi:hypothetical protein